MLCLPAEHKLRAFVHMTLVGTSPGPWRLNSALFGSLIALAHGALARGRTAVPAAFAWNVIIHCPAQSEEKRRVAAFQQMTPEKIAASSRRQGATGQIFGVPTRGSCSASHGAHHPSLGSAGCCKSSTRSQGRVRIVADSTERSSDYFSRGSGVTMTITTRTCWPGISEIEQLR